MVSPPIRRCAIYTRKSTEEGLEQEFNSLDAQREACAAYITSQRHEGWIPVPDTYDDGGFSGGNMDRPGLKKLLGDIASGKVDVIVVYKVDRLTRSLADFAKIVDVLDNAGASFVSVTQSFNTTSSMGRLTLNVLLSFAQFEREVTGERIRDKIAASKKKGMWMGGIVPLGYRVEKRKLIVEEADADLVCHIFRRYTELGSIDRLAADLASSGLRTKERKLRSGRIVGGVLFGKGPLAVLLKNPAYIGMVRHRGHSYPGEHQPIIDQALWDQAQAMLAAGRQAKRIGSNARQPSLFAGMLTDPQGRPMTPSHAVKGSRRYRYYVSRVETGASPDDVWRVPAHDVERLVVDRISTLLNDAHALTEAVGMELGAQELAGLHYAGRRTAAELVDLAPSARRAVLIRLHVAVQLRQDELELSLDLSSLLEAGTSAATRVHLTVPASLKRRGYELRLVMQPSPAEATAPDPGLVGLIARAHAAREQLISNDLADVPVNARKHLIHIARLSYLAPDIITAILDGRQPLGMTAQKLVKAGHIPQCWTEQRKMLGF